jgi:hypothetical protein
MDSSKITTADGGTSIREARLRQAYAAEYPDLKPGVWLPACVLADFVLERGLYQRRTGSASADRLLDESHFEFRGQSRPPRERSRPHERVGDATPDD